MGKKITWRFILIIVVLSLFSWLSLLRPGYFSMHDDMHVMRTFQMDKCIKDGQIPCRWVPDLGYSYGYPLFNYYPPLLYYLSEGFHLAGFSLINSIKIVFGLGFTLSGIFMFFLAREFWGNLGGLLSAIFYIYAPYHAVDVYVRGAMAEHWGLVWFPLILLATYKIIKEEKLKWILLLAISYGCLLLSHLIMSMLFSFIAFIWGVFWLVYSRKYKKVIPLALSVAWGVGLAAFFFLPVVFEKKFAHTETMLMGYFNYLAHFVSLRQLFIKTDWGWGASVWGDEDGMPFQIGYLHWMLIPLIVGLAILFLRQKEKRELLLTIFFTAVFFVGSAFMTHVRSTPIWQRMPLLSYLQFPWRFLGLVIFFASFLSGAILLFIQKRGLKCFLTILLIAGLLFSVRNYFRPEHFYPITDEDKLSGKEWELALTNAIFDYLPIYAAYPPAEEAPKEPQIISGEVKISNYTKGTDWQTFETEIVSDEATLRLPLYDFPGWKVYVDDKATTIDHDNFLGLITFDVSKGKHQIHARLIDTPIRTIANWLSLISWMGLIGFIARRNQKK